MAQQFTKHQKGIGRGIWIGLCAYAVGSIIDWHISGRPSAEWILTTLLAVILTVLGFLAANEQVERAVAWMGATWRSGLSAAAVSVVVLMALLSPYPYFQQTITIGADLPLSGLDKANGQAVLQGAELAVKQANQQRKKEFPYTIKLRAMDDVPDAAGEANAAIGVQNIQTLKDDPLVAGVVGPYNTDVAMAEIPKVNEKDNKLALVSPSTTAECLTGPKAANQKRTQYQCDQGYLNGNNATGAFFRIAAQNNKMAEVYVNCLSADVTAAPGTCPELPHKDGSKYKTIAIIDDGSVFSVGMADSLADQWNAHAKTPVAYGPVSVSGDRVGEDIDARLGEIAHLDVTPDLVVFIGTYQHSSVLNDLLAKHTELSGVDVAYSTSIMNVPPEASFLSHVTGANASRSYYAVAPLISLKDNNNPAAKKFFDDYKNEYGKDPNPYSATGYDAASIIIEAIHKAVRERSPVPQTTLLDTWLKRTGSDTKDFRQAVINKIRDGGSYDAASSATGMYSFAPNSNGDVRDAFKAAVSVFRWDPANYSDVSVNGWQFQ